MSATLLFFLGGSWTLSASLTAAAAGLSPVDDPVSLLLLPWEFCSANVDIEKYASEPSTLAAGVNGGSFLFFEFDD